MGGDAGDETTRQAILGKAKENKSEIANAIIERLLLRAAGKFTNSYIQRVDAVKSILLTGVIMLKKYL